MAEGGFPSREALAALLKANITSEGGLPNERALTALLQAFALDGSSVARNLPQYHKLEIGEDGPEWRRLYPCYVHDCSGALQQQRLSIQPRAS